MNGVNVNVINAITFTARFPSHSQLPSPPTSPNPPLTLPQPSHSHLIVRKSGVNAKESGVNAYGSV